MHPFEYAQPPDALAALDLIRDERAAFVAGGTNLLDLMKEGVATPELLIDIRRLDSLRGVHERDGMVRIGALERMADVAQHPLIAREFPVAAEALLASASAQLRNMATIGGNLLQRTRCGYFRDVAFACNKRRPGSGCPARTGENRMHAILGTSEDCIATNPSDLAVALTALGAQIVIRSRDIERTVSVEQFYRTPVESAQSETCLEHGELIVAVDMPTSAAAQNSHYLKVRDRASYEFALVSAAVGIAWHGDTLQTVRIAFGGVGTVPWRAREAENLLEGKPWSWDAIAKAGQAASRGAQTTPHNAFKVELMQHVLERAMTILRAKHA